MNNVTEDRKTASVLGMTESSGNVVQETSAPAETSAEWQARSRRLKDLGMQILWNAWRIADEAVRSDIECYAKAIPHPEGFTVYDLRYAQVTGATDAAEQAHAIAVAQRAAHYIDLRGDVFPWRLVRVGADHLVRFVAKETQP